MTTTIRVSDAKVLKWLLSMLGQQGVKFEVAIQQGGATDGTLAAAQGWIPEVGTFMIEGDHDDLDSVFGK